MALVLAFPLWASEHTVTISRNEGQFSEHTGVYYGIKDGVMMTFTSGLDNPNFLVEHQQTYFEVRSANYIIKKIVFHCVDSTTSSNLDAFYWGPTTLGIVQNFSDQSHPGTLRVTDPYTAVWTGSSSAMQFSTMARPVRFGSIDIIYDKLDGDIFDLVTNNSQIVNGKTYIIVSQYFDKVMEFKKSDDPSFPCTDIVEWMAADKSKVKVDGNACLFKMVNVKDSTISSNTRKVAWFNTLNGYIRKASGDNNANLISQTTANDYCRAIMYISSNAYNYLCWFKQGGSTSTRTIRYDSIANSVKFKSINNSTRERVWLYKLAESYRVTTVCDPNGGGTINILDGVVEGTSQQSETVTFTAEAAEGYRISSVTVTKDGTSVEVPVTYDPDTDTYSFVMPANDVTVTANFAENVDLYLLGTAMGQGWAPTGPRFNWDPQNEEYYLDVYFKGIRNVPNEGDDPYGYFSLTTRVSDNGDWEYIRTSRLTAEYDQYPVQDGSTATLYAVPGYDNHSENCAFKIPAGVYRITVNAARTSMTITETPLSLTITPASGTTVPVGTEVDLTSDLEATVHAIAAQYNITEDYATFLYNLNSEGWTVGDNLILTDEGSNTVNGQAYIGWIVVENTAVYPVIETPLNYIESSVDTDNQVIVSDALTGTWAVNNASYSYLWAKDANGLSIIPTSAGEGEQDYVKDLMQYQTHSWDQSNWVILDFADLVTEGYDPENFVNKTLKAGTVKGMYEDGVNYRIRLTEVPLVEDATGYYGYEADPQEENHTDYLYNHYTANNFMLQNLNWGGNHGVAPGENSTAPSNTRLFFMNPKIQEVVQVMAVWRNDGVFDVYACENGVNGYDLDGAFQVDWRFNRIGQNAYGQPGGLEADQIYKFHIAVNRTSEGVYGYNRHATFNSTAKGSTVDNAFMIYPLDLTALNAVVTAVNEVADAKTVASVRYYNMMGVESTMPFSGVNIVVTRYTDGSTSTFKVVR